MKCAWCCGPEMTGPAWGVAKCPECEGWNRYRLFDSWEGDLKTTTIVTEMIAGGSMAGQVEPPRTPFEPKATDAELGRAITNIIKRGTKR